MLTLNVAFPLFPVGPDSGGGAEQILSVLESGLVNAGHRSIVIAAEGSKVSGELIAAPRIEGEINDEVRKASQAAHLTLIQETLDRYAIDVIHFHGLDFFEYIPESDTPKLATLHLPLAWYPESIFHKPEIKLNCVSRTQGSSAPQAIDLPVIPNGIDIQRYLNDSGERQQLLLIARICPEKGVHIALQVAHRLDMPLMVAGPVHPFKAHQDYFANCVCPLLDSKRQYVGAVGAAEKISLLTRSKCLLIPSLVAETSSLVAMEAISSGTPVIAFRSGALPEVVDHGQTGFIVDSEDEMVEAVRRVDEISAVTCRVTAENRFDSARMVQDYLALYAKVMRRFGTTSGPQDNLYFSSPRRKSNATKPFSKA